MREILLRGKTLYKEEWVYGFYRHFYDGNVGIIDDGKGLTFEVDEETVGQYTGLEDKNGTRIFDGDIILFTEETGKIMASYTFNGMFTFQGYVEYKDGNFFITKNRNDTVVGTDSIMLYEANQRVIYKNAKIEVIGNIYDNQELLNQ